MAEPTMSLLPPTTSPQPLDRNKMKGATIMKKIYTAPEFSKVNLEQNDILTLSTGDGNTIPSKNWTDIPNA